MDVSTPLVRGELRNIVSMLCTRFPERNTSDVEWLVTDVYETLSDHARVRTHLIPLTLNRCRRLLNDQRRVQPNRTRLTTHEFVGV